MKPKVWPVCRGRMHSGRWRSPGLRRARLRTSLAYRQNLLSSQKTPERHYTLKSTLSRHQSRRAWRCRGVSGRLARGTRDLSPAASRSFPMVLGAQQVQHEPGFIPWMRPPLLAQYADLDVRLYYKVIQYVLYGCGNVLQTTAESTDTPPIHCPPTCAAIRWYVHPASRKPTMWPRSNAWSYSTGVRTRRRGMIVP